MELVKVRIEHFELMSLYYYRLQLISR